MALIINKKPRWSNLPEELLELILMHLPLEDYFHFGLVCKSWWPVMIHVRRLFQPMPLLILKPCDSIKRRLYVHPGPPATDLYDTPVLEPCDRVTESDATSFYAAVSKKNFRKLSVRLNSSSWCYGSSMGWLIMVDTNKELGTHLLNPISGNRIELPPLPQYCGWPGYGATLSSPPDSPDCMVAIQGFIRNPEDDSSAESKCLALCKLSEKTWDVMYQRWRDSFAFYDNKLYIAIARVTLAYVFDPIARFIGMVDADDEAVSDWRDNKLVVVDGKLVLVVRTQDDAYRLYKLEEEKNRWVGIQSLGDRVLLLNKFTAESFSAKEIPTSGFRRNCIYRHVPGTNFLSVYSVEDRSSETISLPIPENGYKIRLPVARDWFRTEIDWFLAPSW